MALNGAVVVSGRAGCEFFVASDAVFHVAYNISIILLLFSRPLLRQSKIPSYLPVSQLLPHASELRLKQKQHTFPERPKIYVF